MATPSCNSIDFYIPYTTITKRDERDQKILTQVLLPQISNPAQKGLVDFFKAGTEGSKDEFIKSSKSVKNKIISLNPEYNCEFETQLRYLWAKDRKEHIKFMQNIEPHQLAALSPYARFYVTDNSIRSVEGVLKNALPITFDKSFDLDFFKQNLHSTARGEGAGIKSIRINKSYNVTADYDPITMNASFFFSSYNVLMKKPAISREYLFGCELSAATAQLLQLKGGIFKSFSLEEVKNITYKELLTIARRLANLGCF